MKEGPPGEGGDVMRRHHKPPLDEAGVHPKGACGRSEPARLVPNDETP